MGGAAAFLHDMLVFDLGAFDPRVIPSTLIRVQQKTQSMHGVSAWWVQQTARGDLSLG